MSSVGETRFESLPRETASREALMLLCALQVFILLPSDLFSRPLEVAIPEHSTTARLGPAAGAGVISSRYDHTWT
jgi:hypothetical protein